MKKIIIFIAALLMLAGCGTPTKDKKESGKTTIATTIFPEYDWVKEIIKGAEGIEVKLLMKNGTDLHNYQPSADDVIEIINSDLFIYVGGESDEWVNDVLDESKNKAINLLDVLGEKAKEEEVIEGMQAEEEDEEESEYDEHVWLSINNAVIFVNEICKRLTDIDQSNAEIYRNNVESYIQKLEDLNKKYLDTTTRLTDKTLIFADRYPFRYLLEDYGLSYYAAFAGCSAETEASFETIAFLSEKVNELNVNKIYIIDGSDGKIAKAVIENSGNKECRITELNSIQSVGQKEINEGISYLSIMEENLQALME